MAGVFTMLDLNIDDTSLRFKNAEASAELTMPVELIGTVTLEQAQANLAANLSHPIWLNAVPAHDGVAVLCGNGPSLADTLDEIVELDATVFACNDGANYLIDRNIEVDYQVILEAQPRMVDELAPAEAHLLASVVDPSLFARCPNAILWHPDTPWIEKAIPNKHPPFNYMGGTICVSMYALSIIYALGFRTIHTFGLDSSFRDGKRYASQEFDGASTLPIGVTAFGKRYDTTYDMKEQARSFLILAQMLKDLGCKVEVHGSGLLPDIYRNSIATPLTT